MQSFIVYISRVSYISEIKTLKDRYKTRRDKLTQFKQKVKSNMEAQYAAIVKEVGNF